MSNGEIVDFYGISHKHNQLEHVLNIVIYNLINSIKLYIVSQLCRAN